MKIAIMAPLVTAIREPQRGGSQAFVSDLARGLAGRGHDVHVTGDWSLGRLSAVSRAADGTLRAGANPRGMQGYAVGR